MALSKQSKQQTVEAVESLLADAKLVVFAHYTGTPVKAIQQLRTQAKGSGTVIRVVKNRLFKRALTNSDKFKDLDTTVLSGQLLYAFNNQDELAPAQNLAAFAKTNPQIEFVGAINEDGQLISAQDVATLASLPTKVQLRANLVATISSPLAGMANVMAGNIKALLHVLNVRLGSMQ